MTVFCKDKNGNDLTVTSRPDFGDTNRGGLRLVIFSGYGRNRRYVTEVRMSRDECSHDTGEGIKSYISRHVYINK